MRRLSLSALALLLPVTWLATPPVGASPLLQASWTGCVPPGGVPTSDLAAIVPGAYGLTLSASGLDRPVRGLHVVLEVRSPGGLPPAWRFDIGGCQEGRIEWISSSASKSCPSIGSLPSTTLRYNVDASGASALLVADILFQGGIVPPSGSTYMMGRLVFDHSASTPTGDPKGCEGMDQPVCIAIVDASMIDAETGDSIPLTQGSSFVRWNDPSDQTSCAEASLRGVAVTEMYAHCANGSRDAQYLELELPAGARTVASHLRLTTLDRSGDPLIKDLAPAAGGVPASAAGAPRWLLATAGFAAAAGLVPDMIVPMMLDPLGGTLVLTDDRPGRGVVQTIQYGGSATTPAFPRGEALARMLAGSYSPTATITPTRWDGTTGGPTLSCPQPAFDQFAIREVALQCVDHSTAGQFVEIESRTDTDWIGPLDLVVRDTSGILVTRVSGLFGARPETPVRPGFRRWLVAGPGFIAANGVIPDALLPSPIPTSGPLVYSLVSFLTILHSITLDPTAHVPVPPFGRSAGVSEDGSLVIHDAPTPEASDGGIAELHDCFCPDPLCGGDDDHEIRLEEVLVACAAGDTTARFVELSALAPGATFVAGLRLDAYDHHGVLLFDLIDLFPGREGEPWPSTGSWLLGGAGLGSIAGVVPDRALPPLDPVGGRVRLYDPRAPHRAISELRYGPGEEIVQLDQGFSVRRDGTGAWAMDPAPHPENSAGTAGAIATCPCMTSRVRLPDGAWISVESASFDSVAGGARYRYDIAAGTAFASSNVGAETEVGDRFVLRGLPAGTPVATEIVLVGSGSGNTRTCGPVHGCTVYGFGWIRARIGDDSIRAQLGSETAGSPLSLPLSIRAGESFALSWGIEVDHGTYMTRLTFPSLPAGTWIESCRGFRTEVAVSTRPSLVGASAAGGRVRLEWYCAALAGRVLRIERWEDAAWRPREELVTDGRGSIVYEDSDVAPGRAYEYRLTWTDDAGAENSTEPVGVEVPAAAFTAALAAGPVVRGSLDLRFTLPAADPVRLEIVDTRGRRRLGDRWSPPESGAVTHRLRPEPGLAPGVYWLRATQGAARATLRFVVLGAP